MQIDKLREKRLESTGLDVISKKQEEIIDIIFYERILEQNKDLVVHEIVKITSYLFSEVNTKTWTVPKIPIKNNS